MPASANNIFSIPVSNKSILILGILTEILSDAKARKTKNTGLRISNLAFLSAVFNKNRGSERVKGTRAKTPTGLKKQKMWKYFQFQALYACSVIIYVIEVGFFFLFFSFFFFFFLLSNTISDASVSFTVSHNIMVSNIQSAFCQIINTWPRDIWT